MRRKAGTACGSVAPDAQHRDGQATVRIAGDVPRGERRDQLLLLLKQQLKLVFAIGELGLAEGEGGGRREARATATVVRAMSEEGAHSARASGGAAHVPRARRAARSVPEFRA